MTGIVLSGGENRRMGTDKAFLKIAGIPLIEHVLSSLKSVFHDLIIVTNAPDQYAAYRVNVVTDAFEMRGPLTGIYSGLMRSSTEYNFIVACDMPYLNPTLISYMAGLAEGHDIVIPSIDGLLEPLHAVYRKRLIPLMEEQIKHDRRRIRELFGQVQVRYVTEQEIDRFDPGRKSFKNLNTPKDYEEAACADSECKR
ncbi:MAG TPA: molybdenum cofactor guanylyltransferase [Nitrospirota bacterium]|nr:molybdenum cofactor guanylyltransferase [Nitrospirota bacterium]